MLELAIPQPGETRNVKDLVFTALAQEHPLSLIELTRKIRKEYLKGVTYQAVRKAANSLEQQGVLLKEEKRFRIDKGWAFRTGAYFNQLLLTYDLKEKPSQFSPGKEQGVYTFNNLFDLDRFWGDVLFNWIHNLKPGDEHECVGYSHYAWWFLISLGGEMRLFESFAKHRLRFQIFFLRDLPLNRWGADVYKGFGLAVKVSERADIPDDMDVGVYGDTIVQIQYPPEKRRRIKKLFERATSTQEIGPGEVRRLAHEPCEVRIIVFKNALMAKSLREEYKRTL